MAQTARIFPFLRRQSPPENPERTQLMESLAHTRMLLNHAYSGFNNAGDGDLIESYVYEINALHARYNYLLRRVKGLEGTE